MNKNIVFISFLVSLGLINLGMSTKVQVDRLRDESSQLQANNLEMEEKIKDKGFLVKHPPISLSVEYGFFMNQVKDLENYSGTSMNVQLDAVKDADDITDHYVDTEYKGVKGLMIRIVVDGLSKEIDMGDVLDDIHLLEKNTDFMVSEISKDNNSLIVKGEVYGV